MLFRGSIARVYSPASLSHSWTAQKNCLTQLVCSQLPPSPQFTIYPYNSLAPNCSFVFTSISFFAEVSIKTLTSDINSDEIFNNSSDPNSAISFAFIHAEKLTLRMKNGLGSTKYKPAEYERLQAIVDAKRLESDQIGQKVNFGHY